MTEKKSTAARTVGSGAAVPRAARAHRPGTGVTAVRRPQASDDRTIPLRSNVREIRSAGGDAFVLWCLDRGLNLDTHLTPLNLQELRLEFNSRSVGGHRRRLNGTHRSNAADRR